MHVFLSQICVGSSFTSNCRDNRSELSACERKRFVEMKSFNSSKSHRLLNFVPSIRPSFLSVILVFVCGCLWVKNETTKERLMALESRINCFPCGETENLDRMTLSPTKSTARDLYKKIQITF